MANPLITADELERILNNDDVRVIDCRWYLENPELGVAEYERGHIPGATYASLDTDLSGTVGSGRHPLPSPKDFEATLRGFGVSPSTRVIVYDDRGGAVAARLWWMLADQGHEMTSVLDGGLQSWVAAGQPLSTSELVPFVGAFRTRPWRGVTDRGAVVSRSDHTLLIDARSSARYRGEEEPVDPRAGHIPGAISLPQTDNLTTKLSFLPAIELHSRFARAGVTESDDVIVHCGSGVTACHNILAMEVAGIERPLLYVGSWSDWSSSDLPVATGDQP
jgi:thiosulfate/3-mercaptopyruvate sulfurtransferase